MTDLATLEASRLALLGRLDSAKTKAERNRQGQFATPPALASEIVSYAISMLPASASIRFLEPGFGTGPFYSALLRDSSGKKIDFAAAYETDPHYAEPSKQLWCGTGLSLRFEDFTDAEPPIREEDKYNLIVCNPPYVRHHHLSRSEKRRLQAKVKHAMNIEMNGLGGLYTYFLVLSQAWMQVGGVGAWLIPSEFMDVNYGRKVKEFLLDKVTLHRIHRFDPDEVQFEDALVSSAVLFFKNTPPPPNHKVEFTFGGSLASPASVRRVTNEEVRKALKWTGMHNSGAISQEKQNGIVLSDLFIIKRGVATGNNAFFILTDEQVKQFDISRRFLTPILPSPRDLETDEILADEKGEPEISIRRYLLSCHLPEHEVKKRHPSLWAYLESGVKNGVHERYLCRHRAPWYSQEHRSPSLFLCTYMGRQTAAGRAPFRFILNHSKATAANVYLMLYPKPALSALINGNQEVCRSIWEALSEITADALMGNGRTYGGGLHKLEPKELANVPANGLLSVLPEHVNPRKHMQMELFA